VFVYGRNWKLGYYFNPGVQLDIIQYLNVNSKSVIKWYTSASGLCWC